MRENDLPSPERSSHHEVPAPISPSRRSATLRRSSSATNIATSSYLGRYELVGLLGVGGMGSVYRVHDLLLDEEIALKILRKDLSESPEAVARFRREVKLARRITHPNVARIYDIGENAGEHFYTMECVLGDSLSALVESRQVDLTRSLGIICQIAEGIAASHKAGVIHRDLKPDNILLSREGRVVITDFGVAIASRDIPSLAPPLDGCGTPKYMAPEQIKALPLSEKTDLYALGLIAFELLCGEIPWANSPSERLHLARLSVAPRLLQELNAEVPQVLCDLIGKLLELEPKARPNSAQEVARLLNELESNFIAESTFVEMTRSSSLPEIATSATPRARAVAFIPFRNEGEPLDGIVAEMLTEDLTARLAASPTIRVTNLTRPKDWEDARDFGRRSNADVVVAGSVLRKGGSEFSVHIQLTEVQHGFVLWSADYRCPDCEIFQLISDIAQEVADALTVELRGHHSVHGRHVDNVEAFLLAQRSYAQWLPESTSSAVSQLRTCLDRTPNDPSLIAYLSLAILRLRLIDADAPASLSAEAHDLARHALDLEPNLAEGHLALGVHALLETNWDTAARRCEEAIRCNPSLPGAHHVLGYLRAATGDVEQGLHMLDVAMRLDRKSLGAAWDAAYVAAIITQHDRAFGYLDRADSIFPNHPQTVIARLRIASWMADHQRLVQARDAASQCSVPRQSVYETILHLFLEAQPDRQIGALTAIAATANVPPAVSANLMQLVAERGLLNGQVEDAWSAVRSAAPHSINWLWFSRCRSIDRLRRDPSFAAITAIVQDKAIKVFAPR